jgi:sulfide:quinone oxidoreductase
MPFGGGETGLAHPEQDLLRPSVRFLLDRAAEVLPDQRKVALGSGALLDYDWLVIATGSRLDHDLIPGEREGAFHFHCLNGARRLAEQLAEFKSGRIVVGAARLPYKCPASVLEFTFLLDSWLRKKGLRDRAWIAFTYPMEDVFPIPVVAAWARAAFQERGIEIVTDLKPDRIDPATRTIHAGTRSLGYDLAVLVPPHVGAPFLAGSGLTDAEGWISVDPGTLKARERIYALGDAANLPRPKSGSAAAFQSKVVAENVLAEMEGRAPASTYDGHVACFLETGSRRAALVDFTYARPPRSPSPSLMGYWKKRLFKKFYFPIIRRA